MLASVRHQYCSVKCSHRRQPGHDRVFGPLGYDGHLVVDELPGMGGELAAGELQVVGRPPEGVHDPAVPAGQAGAGAYRIGQTEDLRVGDLALGPALHDEVGLLQALGIDIHVEAVADLRR